MQETAECGTNKSQLTDLTDEILPLNSSEHYTIAQNFCPPKKGLVQGCIIPSSSCLFFYVNQE
jgi:hypothetical protein